MIKSATGLTPEQLNMLKQTARELSSLPLTVISLAGPSIREVSNIAMNLAARQEVGLLMLDYIQLMTNGVENEVRDISLSSIGLKALAKRMNVPIVAAAQLNRGIEHRSEDSVPTLKDLRGSGSLEQDATTVVTIRQIWRDPSPREIAAFPENLTITGAPLVNPKAVPVRFFVLKNRNGQVGVSEPIKHIRSLNDYQTLTSL